MSLSVMSNKLPPTLSSTRLLLVFSECSSSPYLDRGLSCTKSIDLISGNNPGSLEILMAGKTRLNEVTSKVDSQIEKMMSIFLFRFKPSLPKAAVT